MAAAGQAYTLVCTGVQRLKLSNVREGNIILDVQVRTTEQLEAADIDELYEISTADMIDRRASLLEAAKREALQEVIVSPSYGAEFMVLLKHWEIQPGVMT
jgi:predicted RNA-binding protein associated with RNAse of E/G family